MPEGHTIHRLAQDQSQTLVNHKLKIESPQGRFSVGSKQLTGKKLTSIEAAGKHLFYHFGKDLILHIHLGLFGKYRTHQNPPPPPRGAVRVRFMAKDHTVDLNGPNQCEILSHEEYKSKLARIGADPLNPHSKTNDAWRRIHRSSAPIGLLLMDQSIISGIGNIYRTEILHLMKLHPKMPAHLLSKSEFNQLWKLARRLLTLGVKHNRIITIPEKSLPRNLAKVSRKKLFRIFKHVLCPDCKTPIERTTLASRKVFFCPTCQPLRTSDQ